MAAFDAARYCRRDRYLRGGDQVPFPQRGFAAIRLIEVHEDYAHRRIAFFATHDPSAIDRQTVTWFDEECRRAWPKLLVTALDTRVYQELRVIIKQGHGHRRTRNRP